ncbi:bifunctional fucokinase/fucose-1-phosphate guanylyltransferase [Pontiella sp.]|uniref:bifunctional fucokinase/fucose-1-phosphate guanylyltransferase n=1 Tax=Pontiella sp. TaxID=2837462 RepID=UPI003568F314
MKSYPSFDLLLSLPPNMCGQLPDCEPGVAARSFATFDPPGRQLGSGGGTAYVLEQAWRESGTESFSGWLLENGKLIMHGGGESRRLPPYAAPGKLFIPMPVYRWALGQRLDQTLLDLAEPTLQSMAKAASANARVMVASGDVLVRLEGELPPIPDADVVFFGLWVTPEEAQNFGVMFCDPATPEKLVTFLQKPTPDTIRAKSRDSAFLIDVGIWLLSERAVDCLMKKSGWDAQKQAFAHGVPDTYDLYGSWALNLGADPVENDPEVGALTTAVVPLPDAGFYHFGTCGDMLQSLYELQNLVSDQTKLGAVSMLAQPRQFVQNCVFEAPLRRQANDSLWVENSHIPATWKIASENILTGVPKNEWTLELEDSVCLDFVDLEAKTALRVYGYSDAFRGELGNPATKWINRPFGRWLEQRGLSLDEAGIDPSTDLQVAPLFPVLDAFDPAFVKWMFAAEPEASDQWKRLWLETERKSARQLGQQANLRKMYERRNALRKDALPVMANHAERSVFYKLDLEATSALYADSPHELPALLEVESLRNPLIALHDRMFRAAVRRRRGDDQWALRETEAFRVLRDLIVDRYKQNPVEPRCTLLADQIVWGRCPVRLDFAGGWSDTPPYSLEHGGSVLNIAVELNGQPPIQVFARRTEELVLSIRSIDLGLVEQLNGYEDVRAYDKLGSGFALARAAFAISGFHPDFNGGIYETLDEQLQAMGGGVEISMLAAIPKGSGLGTSSILAATLLGVLSDLSGLKWDKVEIAQRTLALEQMLTSGGGWQDQVGGVFPGIKLVRTVPGLEQLPIVRWLPGHFFQGPAKARMLLYYTGITRVAHDILGEIVRGIFLNSGSRLETLHDIARAAEFCHDAIQRDDFEAFVETVNRSWQLNRRLDSGTNPAAVQEILDFVADDLAAAKLLGAGGGGYLFMIANDADAAIRIREQLETNPPNAGARFVEFALSETGLQVTRS